MTLTSDICRYIEELAPLRRGNEGDEYGLLLGDPARPVRRAGACWLPDSRALARAEAAGLDLLVCHEHPWLGEQDSPWYGHQAPLERKAGQARRAAVYQRTGLGLFRIHSPWDATRDVGIVDQCAGWLGLGERLAWEKYTAVYRVEPTSLGQLVCRISEAMPPTIPARLFGPAERIVTRVGLAIGGFGGNQWNMAEEFDYLDAEVIIWGDMIEHIAHAALELDIPVIETLHSLSEEPGMRALMGLLAARFPGVAWQFLPSGIAHWYED